VLGTALILVLVPYFQARRATAASG
jgi:hypothetical protein